MQSNIMLDLETLGNGTKPTILSIGWCTFNETEIQRSGVYHPLLEGAIDPDTVMWWFKQDKAALERVWIQRREEPLKQILGRLRNLIFTHQPQAIWCNGASFDFRILREWYENYHEEIPWHFRQECCMRALRSITNRVEPEIPHCAESDAIAQAKTVMQIYGLTQNRDIE